MFGINIIILQVKIIGWRSLIKDAGDVLLNRDQVWRVREVEGDIVHRPPPVTVDLVLCVEHQNYSVGSKGRRDDVVAVSFDGAALVDAPLDVVPSRACRRVRRRGAFGMVGVVVENRQALRSDGVVPADDSGCDPVVSGRFLIGFHKN